MLRGAGAAVRTLVGASPRLRLLIDCPTLSWPCCNSPWLACRQVSELVEYKRRCGQAVRARCWPRSEHVSHLRHHRQEYTQLLLGFLAEISLGGGGGGGGSDGAAGQHGSSALPVQPPRARL